MTSEKGGGEESRKASSSEMSLHGVLQKLGVGAGAAWEPQTNPEACCERDS